LLEEAGDKQGDLLKNANAACDGLLALVSAVEAPTARAVLGYVAETGLFTIPDALAPFAIADEAGNVGDISYDSDDQSGEQEDGDLERLLGGWRQALEAPFDQLEKYDRYVRGASQFDTHQGVKGREFPRVMVVVSDAEAGGFMFGYDKLFGAKEKSKTDFANQAAGKETTVDRTRRLFYVTCSRAQQSLAVVYYATDPALAHKALITQGWFESEEIVLFEQ
jgi:DNA helicase-2/ATP-dependent DNA helicase PcrA